MPCSKKWRMPRASGKVAQMTTVPEGGFPGAVKKLDRMQRGSMRPQKSKAFRNRKAF